MGGLGPIGVFGISERDWLSNYRVLKIDGFGGRPPVGGRPGARPPLKSGPDDSAIMLGLCLPKCKNNVSSAMCFCEVFRFKLRADSVVSHLRRDRRYYTEKKLRTTS